MPHADFDNRTAFFADALHLVDEGFAPLLTVAVKGTFEILPGGGHDVKPHWFQNRHLVDFILQHLQP